jgi:hypothetical protein
VQSQGVHVDLIALHGETDYRRPARHGASRTAAATEETPRAQPRSAGQQLRNALVDERHIGRIGTAAGEMAPDAGDYADLGIGDELRCQ